MKAAGMSLDLILNTVSAKHDLNLYLPLLVKTLHILPEITPTIVQTRKGVIVQLGLVLTPHPIIQAPLIFK